MMPVPRKRKAFSLVEIMIVVAILGIIVAIAVPSFLRARALSQMRTCQENLYQIQGAKEQWALENNALENALPDWDELIGVWAYLRATPRCPMSGEYSVNAINEQATCSMSTLSLFPHEWEEHPDGFIPGGT